MFDGPAGSETASRARGRRQAFEAAAAAESAESARRRGLGLPSHLHVVPVDFERACCRCLASNSPSSAVRGWVLKGWRERHGHCTVRFHSSGGEKADGYTARQSVCPPACLAVHFVLLSRARLSRDLANSGSHASSEVNQ